MDREVDLLRYFPRASASRAIRQPVTEADRALSMQFGFDYFDGSRQHGYGGYHYHPRFWTQTVELLTEFFNLPDNARILDVGCAKGFVLYDFALRLPDTELVGLDISEYALEHRMQHSRISYVRGNASHLPFADASFDLVISINTLHNLPRRLCVQGLAEIERVARGASYVVVDGWRSAVEEEALRSWVITAKTMGSVDEWALIFDEAGYTGHYSFWSLPASAGDAAPSQSME